MQCFQEQRYPLLSVYAVFSRAALPIAIGVCSVFKSSATHSYRRMQCYQEQRYPFLSVYAVFSSVQTMVYGFLTCAQMLMHAIVHGGCTDTVRESVLEVDWEKNPLLRMRLETRVSTAPGF